jgi:hypothetical protein
MKNYYEELEKVIAEKKQAIRRANIRAMFTEEQWDVVRDDWEEAFLFGLSDVPFTLKK